VCSHCISSTYTETVYVTDWPPQTSRSGPARVNKILLRIHIMLRVSWTERRTNESVLNEINETRKILNTVEERRWNMIGHVLRREGELLYITTEGKRNGKRENEDDQERLTSKR